MIKQTLPVARAVTVCTNRHLLLMVSNSKPAYVQVKMWKLRSTQKKRPKLKWKMLASFPGTRAWKWGLGMRPGNEARKTELWLTAMCSLDWTGWKPTNEICIDRMVPSVYICVESKWYSKWCTSAVLHSNQRSCFTRESTCGSFLQWSMPRKCDERTSQSPSGPARAWGWGWSETRSHPRRKPGERNSSRKGNAGGQFSGTEG